MGSTIAEIPLHANNSLVIAEYPDFSLTTNELERLNRMEAKFKQIQNNIDKASVKLSLEDVIKIAIANNSKLRGAFRSIQSSSWQKTAATRAWLPTLTLETLDYGAISENTNQQYYKYNDPKNEVSNSFTDVNAVNPNVVNLNQRGWNKQLNINKYSNNRKFTASGSLAWQIFDPTRQPNINKSSENYKSYNLIFETAARSLILELQTTYFELQSLKEIIRQYIELYNTNKSSMKIVLDQYVIEYASLLDLQQAKTQTLTQLTTLLENYNRYITKAANLAEKINVDDISMIVPAETLELKGEWNLPIDDTVQKGKAEREEIKNAIALSEKERWTGLSLLAKYIPSFGLVGTISTSNTEGYNDSSLEHSKKNNWSSLNRWHSSVMVNMKWRFDGGVDDANAQSYFKQSQKYLDEARQEEFAVASQIISSYGQYKLAKIEVEAARQGLESAKTAQKVARERYSIGMSDYTTVVQSTTSLALSGNKLYQSISNHNRAVAQLYRYSATWPEGSEELLANLMEELK